MKQPIHLEQIRAREQAATPGPWNYDGMHNEIQTPERDDGFWLIVSEVRTHPSEMVSDRFGHSYNPDFEFIAHARQDIPALLDEVERLQGLLDRAEWALEGFIGCVDSAIYGKQFHFKQGDGTWYSRKNGEYMDYDSVEREIIADIALGFSERGEPNV